MREGTTVVLDEDDMLDAIEDEEAEVVVIVLAAGSVGAGEYIAATEPGLIKPVNGSNPGFVSSSDDSGAEKASADLYIADEDLFLALGTSVPGGGSGLRILLQEVSTEE